MFTSVDMGLKNYPGFCNFSVGCQGKYLISTTIGKYGPMPVHKPVQSSRSFQNGSAGAQIQVIGISQDNLGFHLMHELLLIERLYSAHRTNRHKDRGVNRTMIGNQRTGTGSRLGIGTCKRKSNFGHPQK